MQLTVDCNGDLIEESNFAWFSGSLLQLEGRALIISLGEAVDFCIVKKKFRGPGFAEFELAIEVSVCIS